MDNRQKDDLLNIFFSNLSNRLKNENNISDITWALCQSDLYFQKMFIDYCFDSKIKYEISDIQREFSKGNSRPDFLITDAEGNEYILEVKLYDKNIHNEYKNVFKYATRSFIANYNLSDKDNIYRFTKTWHGFIKYLEEKEKNNILINGYIKYLKSVTDYFEGANMNLSNLDSVYTFANAIKSIIKKDDKILQKCFKPDEGWIAFDVRYKQKKQRIHFQFGLGFWDKDSFVMIQVLNDTSKGIKEKIWKAKNMGDYYKIDTDYDVAGINILMKRSKFVKLCDENNSFASQEKIIVKYYEEVKKLLE